MNERSVSYHGNETEHQFYTDEELYLMLQRVEKLSYTKGFKAGEKRGYAKGFEAGETSGYQKGFDEGKDAEKEKRKEYLRAQQKKQEEKKKIRVWQRLGFFLLSIAMICFVAKVYEGLVSIIPWINMAWTLGVIGCLIKPVGAAVKGAQNMEIDICEGSGILRTLWDGFREIWKGIQKNKVSLLLFVCFIWLLSGCLMGHLRLIPCMKAAAASCGKTFEEKFRELNPEISDTNQGDEEDNVNQSRQADDSAVREMLGKIDLLAGVKEVFAVMEVQAKEETLKEADTDELSEIAISDNELKQEIELSAEDWSKVFFAGGDYVIHDWDDQDEINEKVLDMVKDARKEKKSCILDINVLEAAWDTEDLGVFEEGTDKTAEDMKVEIEDRIARLSKDEEAVQSFQEIERIRRGREEIYGYYSQQGLTNLIANGEHKQALMLLYYGGHQETIQYHYAKSILWNIEFVEHENTSVDTVRKKLDFIAMRYKDIACVCKECGNAAKASKLQAAFEYAAEHFEE